MADLHKAHSCTGNAPKSGFFGVHILLGMSVREQEVQQGGSLTGSWAAVAPGPGSLPEPLNRARVRCSQSSSTLPPVSSHGMSDCNEWRCIMEYQLPRAVAYRALSSMAGGTHLKYLW